MSCYTGDRDKHDKQHENRMETIGKDGGYIIGPTYAIAPEVPWENIKALYDAIEELDITKLVEELRFA